ncbi:MAG: hypothetical protein R2754_14060 [Microthrixaceae bacterium]
MALGVLLVSPMLLGALLVRERSSGQAHLAELLTSVLPTGEEMPLDLIGLDQEADVTEWMGPSKPDETLDAHRPGPVGRRGYLMGDWQGPISDGERDMEISMYLYQHKNAAEAGRFWKSYPPEVARTDTALFLDPSLDLSEAQLDELRINVDAGSDTAKWQGICLAAAKAGHCAGFYFWAQFCRWTMEVTVAPWPEWRVDSPRAVEVANSLVEMTAAQVGCGG